MEVLESARDREYTLHVPTVFFSVGVNGQALQKHKLELNHHGRLFLLFELPLVWPFNEGSLPLFIVSCGRRHCRRRARRRVYFILKHADPLVTRGGSRQDVGLAV